MGSALKLPRGGIAVLLASLLVAGIARADDDPAALELSKQGYELLLEKKCDKAIVLLKRSLDLDPKPRTLVNLARCEDQLGALRAALAHLNDARDLARRLNIEAMVTQLDTMTADMGKRIPHVVLELAPGAPVETTIKRGETGVRPGTLAVDPGTQTFVVSAPNRSDATVTVAVGEGETKTVAVAPGAPLVVAPPPVTSLPPERPRSASPLRTAGIASMIAGGAAIALGGVFGAMALTRKSDAEDHGCTGRRCTNGAGLDFREDARDWGTSSTIAFLAGGVLAAGGLGMFLFAPSASSDRVGLDVSGRF